MAKEGSISEVIEEMKKIQKDVEIIHQYEKDIAKMLKINVKSLAESVSCDENYLSIIFCKGVEHDAYVYFNKIYVGELSNSEGVKVDADLAFNNMFRDETDFEKVDWIKASSQFYDLMQNANGEGECGITFKFV